MTEQDVLLMPFDIARHKETFTNYLEVVICVDGSIRYAVPSHTEKLIAILCSQMGVDRQGVIDACPTEFYGAYLEWLSLKSGCIPVWNAFYVGLPSPAQIQTLENLAAAEIYAGHVHGEKGKAFATYGGGFRAPMAAELGVLRQGEKEREANPNVIEKTDTWFCD